MKSRIIVPARYPAERHALPAPDTLEVIYENERVTLVLDTGGSVALSREAWNALVRGVEPAARKGS